MINLTLVTTLKMMGKLNYFVEIDPNDFKIHIHENKIIIIFIWFGIIIWIHVKVNCKVKKWLHITLPSNINSLRLIHELLENELNVIPFTMHVPQKVVINDI
jgi:hypothetical protein